MPKRSVRLATDSPEIEAAFAELRRQLRVSLQFPAEALAEAEQAARRPRLPDADETSIPFVTLDPLGSMDLDQAFHIERRGDGYRVRYAIADVAAFVTPGGPMDVEAHERGETLYAPDENARLYPPALSEGAASLLPDQTRPALVWTMDVDETGEGVDVHVVPRARAQPSEARLRRRAATTRRRDCRRAAATPARGRHPPAAARSPPGRRQPRPARAGHHRERRRLRARVPRAAARRGLERPDLPDDRNGSSRPDAERERRPSAHGPRRRPAPRRASAPHGEGVARRMARRRFVPRVRPRAQPCSSGGRRRSSSRRGACSAARDTHGSKTIHPTTRSTPRSRRRTPTRPPRSAGSSIGTSARRASRSRRAPRSRSGSAPSCRRFRR